MKDGLTLCCISTWTPSRRHFLRHKKQEAPVYLINVGKRAEEPA